MSALIGILRHFPRVSTSTLPLTTFPIIACRRKTSYLAMSLPSTRSIEIGEVSKQATKTDGRADKKLTLVFK